MNATEIRGPLKTAKTSLPLSRLALVFALVKPLLSLLALVQIWKHKPLSCSLTGSRDLE
jgi:hypothetical protein